MRKYTLASSTLGTYFKEPIEQAIRRNRMRRLEFASHLLEEDSADAKEAVLRTRNMVRDGALVIGSVHIPFGSPYDPSAADECERKANLGRIRKNVEMCIEAGLGAPHYTLHGSMEPMTPPERPHRMEQAHKSITELAGFFRDAGACVNIENLPRTCGGNCVEEILFMLKDQPENVGMTFDVNHWMNRAPLLPEMIRTLAPHINSFHLSDYDNVDEQHWAIPHQGVIGWHDVMKEIKALPQDINMIFECKFHDGVAWRGNTNLDSSVRIYEYAAYYLENIEKFEATDAEFETFAIPGNN